MQLKQKTKFSCELSWQHTAQFECLKEPSFKSRLSVNVHKWTGVHSSAVFVMSLSFSTRLTTRRDPHLDSTSVPRYEGDAGSLPLLRHQVPPVVLHHVYRLDDKLALLVLLTSFECKLLAGGKRLTCYMSLVVCWFSGNYSAISKKQ